MEVEAGETVMEVPERLPGIQVKVFDPVPVIVTGVPAHTAVAVVEPIIGNGFTVIVKVVLVPTHPFLLGVTVMVAVIGVIPGFAATNDKIFPVPLPANPIEVLLFVQLNVVPVTVPVNTTDVVFTFLHSV